MKQSNWRYIYVINICKKEAAWCGTSRHYYIHDKLSIHILNPRQEAEQLQVQVGDLISRMIRDAQEFWSN